MNLIDNALEFFEIAFDAILRGAAGIRHGADHTIRAFSAAMMFGIGDGNGLADSETKIGHNDSLRVKDAGGSTEADPPAQ